MGPEIFKMEKFIIPLNLPLQLSGIAGGITIHVSVVANHPLNKDDINSNEVAVKALPKVKIESNKLNSHIKQHCNHEK